jgi:hypothetical protein
MLLELAGRSGETDTLMIDATHLKAHRTASSLGLKKGGAVGSSIARQAIASNLPRGGYERRPELKAPRGDGRYRPSDPDVPERRPNQRLHRREGACREPSEGENASG